MTAPIDEARLRELAEAATPGPWEWCDCPSNCGHIGSGSDHLATVTFGDWGDEIPVLKHVGTSSLDQRYEVVMEMNAYGEVPIEQARANAELIAAARTAIPALLDALSAERERGDRAVRALKPFAESAPARDDMKEWDVTTTLVKYLRDARDAFLATQKAEGT